jgi:lia operon protein LiaF
MKQVVIAILLFGIGMLLLLVNVNVISLEIKQIFVEYFPFLALVVVILWFIGSFKNPFGFRMLVSFYLTIYFTLLSCSILGLVEFTSDMFLDLWPLLIIFMAMKLLITKRGFRARISIDKKNPFDTRVRNEGDFEPIKALSIGSVEMVDSNWSLEPMRLYKMIGDYHIDITKAFIPDREIPISIEGWIGNVTIVIPENLQVRIEANVKIGNLDIFNHSMAQAKGEGFSYKSDKYDEAIQRLDLKINLSIGSISIKKV